MNHQFTTTRYDHQTDSFDRVRCAPPSITAGGVITIYTESRWGIERTAYEFHAMNADRQWTLREKFTSRGQRCVSIRDVVAPDCVTDRASATAFMFALAAYYGIEVAR
jgi:hypothetical protein